ncbi:MAG TPA: hypothetical protein VK859_13840 [bacterium]|nr:hypothetical protein [bacterium]
MKIFRKVGSLVFALLAVFWMSGCQQASNPLSSTASQMGPGGEATGAGPGSVMPTQTAVKSQSLPGGSSVNCTQTCSSPSAALGASVTYTVNLAISGSAATGAQITDILPSGLTYVQGSATTLPGGTFTCTGSTLTWVYSTVGPCTCTMTYVAQVNNLVGLVGSTLANTAVMTCTGLSAAISASVNLLVSAVATSTATVCVSTPTPTFTCVPATPTFTFTCAPPTATNTPVPPTPTFTFTCVPPTATFTNTPVPPTPTFTFTSTNTYTFTFTSTNTPVPPTPTFTFTSTNSFTPVPPTSTFTPVPPTATRTFTPVPPTPTRTFTPIPIPTVSITQAASSLTCALGGAVTYTINLAISGAACANAQIQDVLPAGMSYVQGTATTIAGGTFTCTGSTLTWVYNSVGPCSCTMTYVAQVNNVLGLVGSTLANTAVMTCPSLSSSLSASASVQVVASLLGGLGL